MTQLLSAAFITFRRKPERKKSPDRTKRCHRQSREAAQMHHEDRAGVNAFIRGVDRLANSKLPAAVIMCTNRLGGVGPGCTAPCSRYPYIHPSRQAAEAVFSAAPLPVEFFGGTDCAIVAATGPRQNGDYGFTFSDLTQRLLPAIVLDAYPDSAVEPNRANWNRSSHDPNSTISRGAS